MIFGSTPETGRLDVPVDPEAPEAREWLIEELSKPQYQSAQPNWLDRLSQAFFDWLTSLEFGDLRGPPALGLIVIVAVVIVGIVVAFLVFGVPRLNRKSAVTGALFGADDDRNAATIRASALAAAAGGDYSTAIAEMFRCIARGLAERTIITTTPGTTALRFSEQAAAAFPSNARQLAEAAAAFDQVRYLGGTGTEQQFQQLSVLERELRSSRPVFEAALA